MSAWCWLMALKPLIWLCLWAGAACELLIVRGPVDLEAGRGVSALDLWSISRAWLELAAAGWGLSDICFLGQVWDWHIRRLIHWFYHRFAAFRYYMTILCNPDATSILCHECLMFMFPCNVALFHLFISYRMQAQTDLYGPVLFDLCQLTDSLLRSPPLWCSGVYVSGRISSTHNTHNSRSLSSPLLIWRLLIIIFIMLMGYYGTPYLITKKQ